MKNRASLIRQAKGFFLAAASFAVLRVHAVDHYDLTAPTGVMVGDTNVTVTVDPRQGAAPDITNHRVKFTNLPAGVSVVGSAGDATNGWIVAGVSNFTMSVSAGATPGPFTLRVEKSDDSLVNGTQSVTIFRTVSQFTIDLPPLFTSTRTGQGFVVTVTARDSLGSVVQPYSDSVDVSAAVGNVSVNAGGPVIFGSAFVNGVATATVSFTGTPVGSLSNTLIITAQLLYAGQVSRATGSIGLTIHPNVFDHILLLFPGETLTPGLGTGKTGSATAATAGVPINGVSTYLVDLFNNPIRTDLHPEAGLYPVTQTFTSVSHPGTDTVPPPRDINSGNQDAINGLFTLNVSGVGHTLEVSENKNATNSTSAVTVNSAGAANFQISAISSPQSAVSAFLVTITARDSIGNVVTSYNGSATVSANNCAGTGLGNNTVDTNQAAVGPQNTVTFVSGSFTGSIKVTKASLQACLRVDDGGGRVGDSNSFQVQAGPLAMLWITLPGESFTPGAYPGNDAGLPPTSHTAGDFVTIEVRSVDASWNVVSNPGNLVTIGSDTGFVGAPAPTAMDGSGGPKIVAGIQLRTAYPANAQRLTAAMSGVALSRSNFFTVNPRPYNQVIFVAPGETLSPGDPVEPDGKTGLVSSQTINTSFGLAVYLTDNFFNPILNPPLAGGTWPQIFFSTVSPAGATAIFPAPNPFQMTGSTFLNVMTFQTLGTNVIQVRDNSPVPKTTNATIQVDPGPIDHFTVTGEANINAGQQMVLTVTAFDAFGNIARNFGGTVNLELWSDGVLVPYAGAISPTTAVFTPNPVTGGVVNVNLTVNYAGNQTGLGDDRLQVRAFYNLPPIKEGFSGFFSVYEQAVFSDIVMILPGQTYQPGGTPVKINNANSKVAGDAVGVQIYAVDNFGNQVDYTGPVELSLQNPAAFADFQGTTNLVNGFANKFIYVYTAGTQVVVASITSTGYVDTSTITINKGSYSSGSGKLLLLAPGETRLPGSVVGKIGSPTSVVANTNTTFTIVACDPYYNVDTSYSAASAINLTSNDGALALSGISVNSGSATVTGVFLRGSVSLPVVRVTATDAATPAKTSFSDVPVSPGAYFDIQVPSTATAGGTWSLTVRLIDPQTLLPGNYNHSISITAENANGTPATVPIGVSNAVLSNGTVTFLEHYDYVESIRLKITDSFSRLAYSTNISVQPNGLKYVVTLPASKTADELFPATIKLYDTIFDAVEVRNMDHTVFLRVEVGGLPALGSFPVSQVTLNQGVASFNFSYTKAEHIVLFATGAVGGFAPSGADDMDINAGAYVRVQLLAPGESARPGIPSATGKDSSGILTQAAKEAFSLTVLAVDQYWNVVSSVSNPGLLRVRLTADDGSLTSLPLGAFVNGVCNFTGIKLNLPPLVTVTAADATAGNILTQTSQVPLSGRLYIADPVMNFTDFYTGPPRDFRLTIALYRFDGSTTTGFVTGETGNFYVVPLKPDLTPLISTDLVNATPVDVSNPNKFRMDVSGVITLTLSYRVAENVIFKVFDDDGWQGFTRNKAVTAFVPRDVVYDITVPPSARVGPPDSFNMTVAAKDIDTGASVKNFSSAFTIQAIRVLTGLPGTGTLQVTNAAISSAPVTVQQAYTQSGLTRFRVNDGTRIFDSPNVIMLPGDLSGLSIALPGTLEAGTTSTIDVTLLDGFNNAIPGLPVVFRLGNASFGTLTSTFAVSNAFGVASTGFSAASNKSGPLDFFAQSGIFNVSQSLRLLGPPVTRLRVAGFGQLTGSGYSMKPGDLIFLDAVFETGMTLSGIQYAVDGGPFQAYAGPFTFPAVGQHIIRHFGVTQAGLIHTEAVRTELPVFVTATATAEEPLVNYPNPFRAGRDTTFLEYALTQNSNVKLTIYDMLGQTVYELEVPSGGTGGSAGLNRIGWDGKNNDGVTVGNGGYLAVLELRDVGQTLKRKIAVLK